MELRTFKAATMHEALAMVRRDLGPDAALLHTREICDRRFGILPGLRQIEVTASLDVNVPSRFRQSEKKDSPCTASERPSKLQAMLKDFCRRAASDGNNERPDEAYRAFANLLCEELGADVARRIAKMIVKTETDEDRLPGVDLERVKPAGDFFQEKLNPRA